MTNQEILQLFLNRTEDDFYKALNYLKTATIDKQLLSYLFTIHLYHQNKDIRKEARSIFKKHASKELQELVKIHYTNGRAYAKREMKSLISWSMSGSANNLSPFENHPEIDLRECFLLDNYQNLSPKGKLTFLNLSFVTSLPDSVDLIAKDIVSLSVNRNSTIGTDIPQLDVAQIIEKCKQMPKLDSLDISSLNSYKVLPESILELKNLEYLSIGNHVDIIPNDFSALKKLKRLDICGNKVLRVLPDKLPDSLKTIDMQHTLFLGDLRDYTTAYKTKHPQVKLQGFEW